MVYSKMVDMNEKRNQYWLALHAVRNEYYDEVGDNIEMREPTMPHWIEQKYGLKMGLDGVGNWTAYYDVVDPKKFMLFQIKYFK